MASAGVAEKLAPLPRLRREARRDHGEAPIAYDDFKGNPWKTPAWQVILHVVNHATHHRGQAAGFIRAMGKTPPVLDLMAYYRGLNS